MYSFDFDSFRQKVESLGISTRRVQREIGVTNYNTARHILDFDDGSVLSRIIQFCNIYQIRFEDYMLIDGKPLSELIDDRQMDKIEENNTDLSIPDEKTLHQPLHLQGDLLSVFLKHSESIFEQNRKQLVETYERLLADKDRQINDWKARAERLERELNDQPVSSSINPYINERTRAYESLNR